MEQSQKSEWVWISVGVIFLVVLYYVINGGTGGASGIGTAPQVNLQSLESFNLAAATESDNTTLAKMGIFADLLKTYQTNQDNLNLGMAQISANSQQAQLNAATSLDMANIQANTTLQGLQIQSNAAQSLANLASLTQENINNQNITAQTNMQQAQLAAQANALNKQSAAANQNSWLGFGGALLAGLGL